jgi:hypothetical protein
MNALEKVTIRKAFAPSLRQYELDQVHRVPALPRGPAESQPLLGTPLVKP